jgi:polar amino acid transport system substrate-binding protein
MIGDRRRDSRRNGEGQAMSLILKQTRAALMALLVLAVSAVLHGHQVMAQDTAIDRILKRGTLNVGLATFVPWSMRDKEGNLIGFEIDVAKRLAEDLGVEPNFVPTAWDGIIPALIAGKFDVIISGMTVTPKRNLTVNFSIPYAHSGLRLVASKKLAEGKSTLEEFNKSDVVYVARRGSTASQFLMRTFPKATGRFFDEDGQSFLEVVNGRAALTAGYDPTPATWIARYPDEIFVPINQIFNRGSEAFALRKGDVDTLNVFNNWILLRWQDGWLQERNDYWFRTREWAHLVPEQ